MLKRFDAQVRILKQSGFTEATRFVALDMGTEFGHTGRILKESFPACFVDGVEIHGPMLQECKEHHGEFYDDLYHADALEFLRITRRQYDVIVAAEIIEHLDKEKGWDLLATMRAKAKHLAIVTSPIGFKAQGPIHDNPHEVHLCGWEPDEMLEAGYTPFLLDPSAYSLGVYFWRNPE